MLTINLVPVNLTPSKKRRKPAPTDNHVIDSYSSNSVNDEPSLQPQPQSQRRNRSSKHRFISDNQQQRHTDFLSPGITCAFREIYHRYTSGDTSRRLALGLITTKSSSNSIAAPYSTHHDSIGARTFYLDADGQLQAAAWSFIRDLYNDTQLDEMTVDDFVEHFSHVAEDGGYSEILRALNIHGYTIDRKTHGPANQIKNAVQEQFVLDLSKRSLGLRAFAHLSQHLSVLKCSISSLNLSNNQCTDMVGAILLDSLATSVPTPRADLPREDTQETERNHPPKSTLSLLSKLRELDMSFNYLGQKSMQSIAKMIFTTHLRTLKLVGVRLGESMDAVRSVSVLLAPSPHSSLYSVDLSDNQLSNIHVVTLANALREKNDDEVKNRNNKYKSIPTIPAAVQKRRRRNGVKYLLLKDNRLGHYGIGALGTACVDSTVETLDVSGNPLGSVGAIFLSECLKETKTLKTLIVERCQLGTRLSEGDGDGKKSAKLNFFSPPNMKRNMAAAANTTTATTESKFLYRPDSAGLLALITSLGFASSLTSVSMSENWCGNDRLRCAQAAAVLSKMLPRTQLTHLNISGVGLGSAGIASIGNALHYASGTDRMNTIQHQHQMKMNLLKKKIGNEKKAIDKCIVRLREVRRHVEARKKQLTKGKTRMETKSRAMVRSLQRSAERKSPVKAERQAKVNEDKLQYAERTLSRSCTLAAEIDTLDQLDVAPSRELERREYRRRRLLRDVEEEIQNCARRLNVMSTVHLECKLISLNVSWNTWKNETSKEVQRMSLSLEHALSSLPSLTSLRASGNKIPLDGTNGMRALGRGAQKGMLQTLHTHDGGKSGKSAKQHTLLKVQRNVSAVSLPILIANNSPTRAAADNATTMVTASRGGVGMDMATSHGERDSFLNMYTSYHGLSVSSVTSNPLVSLDASTSHLSAADAIALAEGIRTSKHAMTVRKLDISNNRVWHTNHSKTLGNPQGMVQILQLIRHCPNLNILNISANLVESAIDSRRIRNVISTEIGVKPHILTRDVWRVPSTSLETLDVRDCGLFLQTGSLREVLENIERYQEIIFFFTCLSKTYKKKMTGDNTKMPLQWENRSPADVALQILSKHHIPVTTWSEKRQPLFQLLKQWNAGDEILVHGG